MTGHPVQRLALSLAALVAIAGGLVVSSPSRARAAGRLSYLERIEVDTFAKLREVERYQLRVAEKYYLKGEWKVALAEYEKYLTLYERSPAAPYAQLMWSHCQTRLRRVNTAITEGFQSVIDYWPDSPEATLSAYLIGRSYKSMGEMKKARRAYGKVLEEHGEHLVAVLARVDLADIARIEGDVERRVEIWKDLTFSTPRRDGSREHCERAARELASHVLRGGGDLDGAREALATNYRDEAELLERLHAATEGAIRHLVRTEETRETGRRLADRIIAEVRAAMPLDTTTEDGKRIARTHWLRIASTHGAARRDEKVWEVYQKIIELFGKDDGILGRVAEWLKSHDRRDDARRVYGQFEDRVRGQSLIADMYREESRYDPAIEIYRELMQADAERIDHWQWEIAECYDASKRYKEAIHTYRQCDRFPANYNAMARCHRKLKEWNEALVLYRQVMSHEPSAPEALLQIAYTHERAAQRESAIRTFRQVCKRYPRRGQASRAHAHLQTKYKISVTLGGAKDE